jgi:hypothetical protein
MAYRYCKLCGNKLTHGMDMGTGICGKCWFDSKKSYDEVEEDE